MIPSRPLYLGDIIGNTFVIAVKTWTRSAAAACLFMLVPAMIFLFTATGFLSDIHDALVKENYLTPEKLEHFRQDFLYELRQNNPLLLKMYGIPDDIAEFEPEPDFPPLVTDTSTIDTAYVTDPSSSADSTVVHDSMASADTAAFVESYDDDYYSQSDAFYDKYGDSFAKYLYWAIVGYLLMIVGSLAYQTVAIDLASRQFEERPLKLWAAVKATLRTYLWVNLLQFLILIFILAFGLGVAIQIGEFLDPTVAGLLVLAALIMTMISAIRLLFAQPALVSENLGPLAALKRSWEITKGHSWRIFGTLIVFGIVMFVVYIILSIPLAGITGSATEIFINFLRGTEMNAAAIYASLQDLAIRLIIMMMVTTILFCTLSPAFMTVFYYDLRTRKDGPLMYHDDDEPPTPELAV